jgi:hypothetical protein
MKMSTLLEALERDLTSLVELGDEVTRAAGARIASASVPILTVRIQEALAAALAEVDAQLPEGRIELRVSPGELRFVYLDDVAEPPLAEGEATGRLTLRLPERLKQRIEQAASFEGVSVNTYVVRSLNRGLTRGGDRGRSARRISGYGEA